MLKEMPNILSHQRNANQNNTEIPTYTCQNGQDQNTDDNLCWRGYGVKENTFALLVGVQTDTATLEIIMAISQKIRKQLTSKHSNTTFAYIPKECLFIP